MSVKYRLNGKEVTDKEFSELPEKPGWLDGPFMTSNTYTEHDPLLSDGCGVMKAQVGDAREMIRRHNIQGASVLDDGKIRFTSRRARKEFLNHRGLVDNDGGYND